MKNKLYLSVVVLLTSIAAYFAGKSSAESSAKSQLVRERRNQEIVRYFGEICIGSEYEWAIPVTHKFRKKAKLFVFKDSLYHEQDEFISEVLSEFNQLPEDGFRISRTSDSSAADIRLYLSSRNNLPKMTKSEADTVIGQFHSKIDKFYITSASIFIDSSKPLAQQKAALMEEIVQSAGLFKDSDFYMNSIFFQYKYSLKINTQLLSKEDKQIIRLLYHPKMTAGLSQRRAADIALDILNR